MGRQQDRELIHGRYCQSETEFWQMEASCADGLWSSQLTGPGSSSRRVGLGSAPAWQWPCSKNTFQIESMSTGGVWCAAQAGQGGCAASLSLGLWLRKTRNLLLVSLADTNFILTSLGKIFYPITVLQLYNTVSLLKDRRRIDHIIML